MASVDRLGARRLGALPEDKATSGAGNRLPLLLSFAAQPA